MLFYCRFQKVRLSSSCNHNSTALKRFFMFAVGGVFILNALQSLKDTWWLKSCRVLGTRLTGGASWYQARLKVSYFQCFCIDRFQDFCQWFFIVWKDWADTCCHKGCWIGWMIRKRYNVGLENLGLRNSKWYGLGSILYLLNLLKTKTVFNHHFIARFSM